MKVGEAWWKRFFLGREKLVAELEGLTQTSLPGWC